jgi:hypothetical protein
LKKTTIPNSLVDDKQKQAFLKSQMRVYFCIYGDNYNSGICPSTEGCGQRVKIVEEGEGIFLSAFPSGQST